MSPASSSAQENFLNDAVRQSGAANCGRFNQALSILCIVLSFLTLLPLVSLLYLLLAKGIPLLSWSVFTELPPRAGMLGGGFGNAVIGSLIMVGLGVLFSTPLGILSAIYINEYDPRGSLSNAVRFVAKLLTGIPSIICGVFAFGVVVLTTGTFSAWAGGGLGGADDADHPPYRRTGFAQRALCLPRSRSGPWCNPLPNHHPRRSSLSLTRYDDRADAGSGPRGRGNGSPHLHRSLQPVLAPIP